jgi:hypothetical protein
MLLFMHFVESKCAAVAAVVDGWVGCNSMYRVYVVSCGSWSLRLLCFCFGD